MYRPSRGAPLVRRRPCRASRSPRPGWVSRARRGRSREIAQPGAEGEETGSDRRKRARRFALAEKDLGSRREAWLARVEGAEIGGDLGDALDVVWAAERNDRDGLLLRQSPDQIDLLGVAEEIRRADDDDVRGARGGDHPVDLGRARMQRQRLRDGVGTRR